MNLVFPNSQNAQITLHKTQLKKNPVAHSELSVTSAQPIALVCGRPNACLLTYAQGGVRPKPKA